MKTVIFLSICRYTWCIWKEFIHEKDIQKQTVELMFKAQWEFNFALLVHENSAFDRKST